MKAWKVLILLGGIAGIVGFFLPFVHGVNEQAKVDQSVSAYRLVRGVDVHEIVAEAERVGVTRQAAEEAAQQLEAGLSAVRGLAVLAYAPAALLALIGAFATARGRMGRLGGLLGLVFGVLSAAIWGLLFSASHDAKDASSVSLAIGVHLLLVAGLAGALGGLGALISPDRGA